MVSVGQAEEFAQAVLAAKPAESLAYSVYRRAVFEVSRATVSVQRPAVHCLRQAPPALLTRFPTVGKKHYHSGIEKREDVYFLLAT